jgi:RHS repeat-associated protein
MNRVLRLAAVLLLSATPFVARAQSVVSYSENFQSYGTQANPPGWIDTSIGNPKPTANGLYKTWPDPLNKTSPNIVYGTKQSSGKPEGNNPRIGTFSTLSTQTFAGQGRFEYRGRILRGDAEGRIGVTFFSSYPAFDAYYLIGLWSQPNSANLTMQLFGFGAGTITGTRDSNVTIAPNSWYQFVIQVDDANNQTRIRARFWPQGTTEPSTFSIDAVDAAATRLVSGRIGFWAAAKGDAYIDDLSAKSPVDHNPPVIVIRESGRTLTDGTSFNHDIAPELLVSDDLSTFTFDAKLDGAPFTSLTPVTAEGLHTLTVHAVDGPGNVADAQVRFLIDKTGPTVEILEGATPFPTDFWFNRNVIANARVTDANTATTSALLDGQPYTLGTPIVAEGTHSISVTAVDVVGQSATAGPITFTIDKTSPLIAFTSHANGHLLDVPHVIVSGTSDDSIKVVVSGNDTTVDTNAKTFTSTDLPLLEGENTLVATGTDRAGNTATATLQLAVDTRAPEVTIAAPNADACVDGTSVSVSGTVTEARLDSVKVTVGTQTVNATLGANGAWSASVPVTNEGRVLITVEAKDQSGHTQSTSRNVIVDRSAPIIEILQSGAPFTAAIVNRAVSLFVRANDADANVVLTTKLDGAPYVSGTSIATEGPHSLQVSANDCAGHSAQKSVSFVIDLTAPTIHDLDPQHNGAVGTMPSSIRGVTDSDVAGVIVDGTQLSATPNASGAFVLNGVAFAEGTNKFRLVATDRAGNVGAFDYVVSVHTIAPTVEIRESGLAIVDGSTYNRAVTPVVRASDPDATVAATLNGAPYTSGTTISADGSYTIVATATDQFGHSGRAEASFSIDRTPPLVTIATPADGATIRADRVDVRGNAGDSVSATINGQPLTLAADGSFAFNGFPLDLGPTPLDVVGRDRAGNSGRATVIVTRDDLGAGILITYPPDRSVTNRSTTDVVGRLLTAGRDTAVTIGGSNVAVDATGAFRVTGYALAEGENSITATATAANGVPASATTHVTADFTPPSLTILESGQPLADNVRFATEAVLSLDARDSAGAVTTELSVDGAKSATIPFTITTAGGHSVVATARDLAGNEARAERTLFIGNAGGGTSGCTLDHFDPADGAVVLSNATTLIGRAGSAIGVKVNGIAALVADGAFSATVELPNEGPNSVTLQCTDAHGTPTGTPVTITLQRVTGNPSIAISSPEEGFITGTETIAVSGTIGNGVVSADVNGVAATIAGNTFSVPNVHLAEGLNILTAHGRNAAGRVATASRRITLQKTAPAISISAPLPNATTGASTIDVTGTYTNLDPSTLTIRNLANNQTFSVASDAYSNTTGSFRAENVSLTAGEQTLRVSGRDRLNRAVNADVVVKLVAGAPSIAIDTPLDHDTFGAGSDEVAVRGTFAAAAGSTVDVNGVAATLTGNSYNATVKFGTLAGGFTPIVARVTEPGGASAIANIVVTQLTDAPKVVEAFPAPNAAEVDAGALLLVLFSQPMDGSTMAGAFRLEDGNGTPITGSLYLDKEVLTFAPATLLSSGGHYTLRVSTSAKNLAGTALASAFSSSFTVASSAPSTPPTVTPISNAVCGQSITIAGTATPGARVRLSSASLVLNTAADTSGQYSFTYPISGQSGFALIRVQTVGSDGSLSPAAELNVRVDCSGPSVLNATYDRLTNLLTIQFSETINPSTVTVGANGAVLITDGGATIGGAATFDFNIAAITPATDLRTKSFTLTVSTAIQDTIGNHLVTPYTQEFAFGGEEPSSGNGTGFISGEVYDATTGRPLSGASIAIDVAAPAPIATATDARGRYLSRLPEGAHTIQASLNGYTTVWREIIVPAGAGVIPIDIRLTKRGNAITSTGAAMTLAHGGDTAITKAIELTVPAGVAAGAKLSLTAIGAQALTGLLPLGWSPLASAEVAGPSSIAGATLTFNVPAADITAAAQNLSAVQYDATRDEWRVLASVISIGSNGKAPVSIGGSGTFALVYADKAPGLVAPPLPVAGDVLQGVPAAAPDAPAMVDRDFTLDPAIVLPSGRTVATLRIEGAGEAKFPSGTAVQAYIDEDLRLADGSRLLDPPFATDLLLYRNLAGTLGIADFHLAPSAKAAQVVLEVGFDHIRILPYPGRLDRGTLIGSEGGRVPADDRVAVEIPTGAVPEPLRATATSLTATDLGAIGAVAGFRVVGGFQLTLQRATQPAPLDLDEDGQPDPIAPVELFVPARATFSVDASQLPSRTAPVILGELLDDTPYGRMIRLAAPMIVVDPTSTTTPVMRFTTRSIDRAILPVDGVAHEGRYVVLAAENAIAFATGTVHLGAATGRLMPDTRVTAPPFGVADLSRSNGIYNIAVPATAFTLVPRHSTTGDGAAYTHATAAAADSIVRVDLALVAQPPALGSVVVLRGNPPSQAALGAALTTDVALTTNIRASLTPNIEPSSITADSITVIEAVTGTKVPGRASADGNVAVLWTLTAGERLKPNTRYNVILAPSIRGANGATIVRGASYSIATVTQLTNSEIHRERIRITIPDANGLSRISGDPGALPAGWQAVAVRRIKDFFVRYQATAAGDGSFAFHIGDGDPRDRVTMGDLIDLQVINNNGALAGIYALTPFVTEDGKGFVAPPSIDVKFTSPDGITVAVPAGAFDKPTIVSVEKAQKADFLDIPRLEDENEYATSVDIEFEGFAKKPLNVEVAVPAGFDTAGKDFILAWKGMSVRGPRLAVTDLMHVENGKFTTIPNEASNSRRISVTSLKPGTNRTLTGKDFSAYLLHLIRGGRYMVLDIKQPVGGAVGWAVMEGLQANYDLMWDIFWSYYDPFVYVVERPARVIPVLQGVPFTVYGIDRATGLQAFQRAYDPIPIGEPGSVVSIPSPQQNDGGPYPVFGTPFRVDVLDLDVEQLDIRTIRNFKVTLQNGTATVAPGDDPLDSALRVELLNVRKGTSTSGTAGSSLTIGAQLGDRLVLSIEQKDVDAANPISIVFNEPLFLGNDPNDADAVDAILHTYLKLEQAPEPPSNGTPVFSDITAHAKFSVDSGDRRVNVELPGALQREAVYRLTLKGTLADATTDGAGLKLGQGTVDTGNGNLAPVGGGTDVPLLFHTRKPAGEIGSFLAATSGTVRGLDLYNNVLYVGSLDGGLRAFDVSNPAAINGSAPLLAHVGPPETTFKHGTLTIDRHGRIFSVADMNIASALRTYRVEDFENGSATAASGRASTLINWELGYSSMIGLPSNTMLSDRPESIPYRIKTINQDLPEDFANRDDFVAGTGASETGDFPLEDMKRFTVSIPFDNAPYNYQRITVENVTLDMRWSADATIGGSATIGNVLARSTDYLRVVRNKGTYAVVAHLGYGIGVYDVNAMESNRHSSTNASNKMREQVFLGNGIVGRECNLHPPDWAIGENYLNTDVEVRGDPSGDLFVYAIHPSKGVLDYRIHLPGSAGGWSNDSSCDQRGPTGLVLRSFPDGNEVPRITALRSAIARAGGNAYPHFMNMSQVHWSITGEENAKGERGSIPGLDAERDYLLIASLDYGVVVVETSSNPSTTGADFPLENAHVADVLWIPGGATGVRVMQDSNVAVVNDRNGRVVLVDLSRIDERWDADGNPVSGLFPTAAKAIAGVASGPGEVGADDPRIIWKSEPGMTSGALPPVFDSSTGIIYGAKQTARTVKAVSAIDPTVRMKVNLGGGMTEVGGIVPLGIAPPDNVKQVIDGLPACAPGTINCRENASMGAFRLEVSLPGGMLQSLSNSSNQLWVAVESERIAGAITEQTPDGFPRAHLRRTRRNGSAETGDRAASNFLLRRAVPEQIAASYKYQRGFNKFVSPWIIAIADPRASEKYDWHGATKQQKEEAGCAGCERPEFLRNHGESEGIYELYTNGRYLTVRPESGGGDTIFTGTDYAYLGQQKRIGALFTTIMADTVRPTEVLAPGQNPPVATGMIAETIFLHSGELQTGQTDLSAGGRAGSGVVAERTYRSRTLGNGAFGQGWDSPLMRRLRALPNGDVEYRDGSDVWTFHLDQQAGEYQATQEGLFLRLARTARGWSLVDQQWRVTDFDDLGRITLETDEFYDPSVSGSGNLIRYVYDDTGRLTQIIDPVQRATKFTYWKESEASAQGAFPGLIKEVEDWRNRKVDYHYDNTTGSLIKVELANVTNTTGGRPTIKYDYAPAGSSYTDKLELRTNLQSITDPNEAGGGGTARLRFTYDASGGFKRDRVIEQKWGTGESASFTYDSPTQVTATDVLGQVRKYTLTEQPKNPISDRAHILSIAEQSVPVSGTPFGQLPGSISASAPATSSATRTYNFTYGPGGVLQTSSLDGVRTTTLSWASVEPEAPGFIPTGVVTSGNGASITEGINYQAGANRSTFVASMTANGKTVAAPEPSRNYKDTTAANDQINNSEKYDNAGQLTSVSGSGGTDAGSAGANAKITYAAATDAQHRRGLPTQIEDGGLTTRIDYPSPDRTVETDARGVVTSMDYDSWQRPMHLTVAGPDTSIDERWEYDATGNLRKHTRRQGSDDVSESYEYDVMGRQTAEKIDNVAGAGTAVTSVQYNLSGHSIITTYPGGATSTVTIDSLGRMSKRELTTGGDPIVDSFAYDLDDHLVYESDALSATAYAYDARGEQIGVMDADGTKTTATLDGLGQPTSVEERDSSGAVTRSWTFNYTEAGRLQSTTKTAAGQSATMEVAWDGGGRTTGVSDSGRASHAQFDSAGRLKVAERGTGSALSIANTFERAAVSGYDGRLPQSMEKSEKTGSYQLAMQYNAVGDATTEKLGSLEWTRKYDQAGNITASSTPRRGSASYEYDALGSVKNATLPGGGSSSFSYHPTGALASYTDPSSEVTSTTNDLIGRPTERRYKDGTSETIEWQGRRVKTLKDRAGRTRAFLYNAKGQIGSITNTSGAVLDEIEYDNAGHITRWKTRDAINEYSDFDGDGRPRQTTQSRLRNGTVIEKYTQQHTYNVHGERTAWTMPSYAGFSSASAWTKSIAATHDDAGNLTRIERTMGGGSGGGLLLEADYRNTGRPERRIVTTVTGTQIVRDYGYDASTGLPNRMSVRAGGMLVAGSFVTYDGVQKSSAQLLGVSGGSRSDSWTYDERSRLQSSVLARDGGATPDAEQISAGDFRGALARTPSSPVDPPSVVFQEDPSGGHKISVVQRGNVVEQFTFDGGERRSDGRFLYEYDDKGHLATVTQKSGVAPRRVQYFYDSNDRMIGRRAEYAAGPSLWKLEDRPEVLGADGLPAETSFVWDPIDDQLVAIFKTGASENPLIDSDGGLLRQIIHGGARYDDPVEVAVADPNAPNGVSRLYPIYDEAGAGSLDVIVNEQGRIVSRNVEAGPYGEDEASLRGAAVDRIAVAARRDLNGNVTSVDVTLRATEDFAHPSLAAGVRLGIVDAAGVIVRTTGKEPALANEATVQWSFTAAEWNALVDPASVVIDGRTLTPAALSVAVTKDARAAAWGALPFLPATVWAVQSKPVYTTVALPLEVRESLANLSQWLASIPADQEKTTALYEVPSLYALASPRGFGGTLIASAETLIVSSTFHAHPFVDPMSGKSYVRARWFDPQTGTWLTPDPRGYVDSPNLYAYSANDPVNKQDPTGELWSLVIDLGFAAWDTYQYASGGIDGKEYALRMALTGASLVADAATGGMGGGLAVRAAAMAGRAGRVARGVMRAAVIVNRANMAVTAMQATASLYAAVRHGDYTRAGLSGAQVALNILALRRGRSVHVSAGATNNTAEAANRLSQRERVLANIAESAAARRASRFPSVAAQNEILTDISQRAQRIADRYIRMDRGRWARVYNNPALGGTRILALFNRNPNLVRSIIRGNLVDDAAKRLAMRNADRLPFLQITPRGRRGPDFINRFLETAWDVTTQGSWQRHVDKYQDEFGDLLPLIYR